MHRSRLVVLSYSTLPPFAVGRFSLNTLVVHGCIHVCVVREFDTLYLSNKIYIFTSILTKKNRAFAKLLRIDSYESRVRNLGNDLQTKKQTTAKQKCKSMLLIELIRDIRFCFVSYFISRIGIMCVLNQNSHCLKTTLRIISLITM